MFDLEHNNIEDLIFVSHCFSITDRISILSDRNYYYLSDYEIGDNISIHGSGGVFRSFTAFMKCLNYYIVAGDTKKYSSFLNLLIDFIRLWLDGGLNVKDKLKIMDSFSVMIDDNFVDYKYIVNENIKHLLNIKNRNYEKYINL